MFLIEQQLLHFDTEFLQYVKSKLLVIHLKTLILFFSPIFPLQGVIVGQKSRGWVETTEAVLKAFGAPVIYSHAEFANLAVELLGGKVIHGFPGVPFKTYLTARILVSINGILVTIKLIISGFPPDSRWKRWRRWRRWLRWRRWKTTATVVGKPVEVFDN